MNIYQKLQLFIVDSIVGLLNVVLRITNQIFFKKLKSEPNNILIYKIGNIGDIVCAIPSFIEVRNNFPKARITLLTSPGVKSAIGARELITGAWYIDELEVYYADDIDTINKKRSFINQLKKKNYDLFIQLPDDLANFKTLLRNMVFAKLIGVWSAYGFKIRTIQLFKKTQVDYTKQATEVESLLDILRENNIKIGKVEYAFSIPEAQKNNINNLLKEKWGKINKKGLVVAISGGGKREANQWPKERFKEIIEYLCGRYNVKIIIMGGNADVSNAELMTQSLENENYLIAAGKIGILETIELLKHCSFLISNSTGTIHLAAAVGLPAVGIYSIRDVPGRWFPYGFQHEILYHKSIDCDYKNEDCIKISIDDVSVDEVKLACDKIISEINFH